MHSRFTSRAVALLVAGALSIVSIGATAPAFADDSSTAAATPNVNLTGFVTAVGDEETGLTSKLFRVVGHGYLRIDFSGVDLGRASFEQTGLDIAIPAGVTVGSTTASTFTALAAYNESGKVLTALAVTTARMERGTERMVSQTEAQDATHRIFAVIVNPKEVTAKKASTDQTVTKVQATVAAASGYWSDQSSGLIDFTVAGTVPFYNSSYSCRTNSGTDGLWREASKKAAAKIGYEDAFNSHLVLFFPGSAGSKCGGAIGIGTIGGGVNSGGLIWTVGTDSAIGKATLTHELGHNLSLGHANWADCAAWGAVLDIESECEIRHYGDVMSVMGYGLGGKTGGSLSSASAIRSGIWSDESYDVAVNGTQQSYTLQAVSSNAGKRAVIVEDSSGADYFVEYRNFTGRDAQLDNYGCGRDLCVPAEPGVRVLRLQNYSGMKGFWGDDDYLVGRYNGGKRVNYLEGESFETGGVTVEVTDVTSTTATVKVTRPELEQVQPGRVDIGFSLTHDQYHRVGDVWTAFVSEGWKADGFTYQWYSGGYPIAGATGSSYTLRPSDVGHSVGLAVTGFAAGTSPVTVADHDEGIGGYGPVSKGFLQVSGKPKITGSAKIGTVFSVSDASTTYLPEPADLALTHQWYRSGAAIAGATGTTYASTSADYGTTISVRTTAKATGYNDRVVASPSTARLGKGVIPGVGAVVVAHSGLTLAASVATSEVGVSRTYQWYRGSSKISRATKPNYTLVAADYGKNIAVRVTLSKKNYASAVVASTPANYSITPDIAKPVVSGDIHVGGTIAATPREYDHGGVETAWQWYRNGKAIQGETSATHAITTTDRGTVLTVRVTASAPGFLPSVSTSAATQKVGTFQLAGAHEPATIERSGAGIPTAVSGISEADAKVTYQWLRNGVAISKATRSTYTPTSGDYGKRLSVRVTATKSSFTTVVKVSERIDVSVVAEGQPSISVTEPVVGDILTADLPTYSPSPDAYSYQWYASGTAISGATAATLAVKTAHKGKTITVRVTAKKAGWASSVLTSAKTAKVAAG